MENKFTFDSPHLRSALELLSSAIASDETLRAWFLKLEDLPSNLRTNAILQITTDMRHGDEDPNLIGALAALCEPSLYRAVKETIESLD